jgi:hypothetical protein
VLQAGGDWAAAIGGAVNVATSAAAAINNGT